MKRFFAIVTILLLLLSDQAKATVVFTDSFTVAADVNLDAYPGTPDYAMVVGASTDLKVIDATDRIESQVATLAMARLINAAVPTGDQEITATMTADGGAVSMTVRTASGAETAYLARFVPDSDEITIYRVVAGGYTELTLCSRVFGDPFTGILKATGTGATVTISAQADATSVCSVDDSSVDRLTSGTPGFNIEGANIQTYDNVSVDNLAAAGGGMPVKLSLFRRMHQ